MRKLPGRGLTVHDGWAVTKSGRKGGNGEGPKGGAGRASNAERNALQRAFADVKPLDPNSRKRVTQPPEPPPARPGSPGQAPHKPIEPLQIDREGNGIVLAKRRSTHSSILDALEDPQLEVDAECDLHGLTSREAERHMHRFVQDCQKNGKRWVLIIVGKGLHSPGGKATLKTKMVDALSSRAPARFVLAFRTAPRHLGGTGAVVARLVDRL